GYPAARWITQLASDFCPANLGGVSQLRVIDEPQANNRFHFRKDLAQVIPFRVLQVTHLAGETALNPLSSKIQVVGKRRRSDSDQVETGLQSMFPDCRFEAHRHDDSAEID